MLTTVYVRNHATPRWLRQCTHRRCFPPGGLASSLGCTLLPRNWPPTPPPAGRCIGPMCYCDCDMPAPTWRPLQRPARASPATIRVVRPTGGPAGAATTATVITIITIVHVGAAQSSCLSRRTFDGCEHQGREHALGPSAPRRAECAIRSAWGCHGRCEMVVITPAGPGHSPMRDLHLQAWHSAAARPQRNTRAECRRGARRMPSSPKHHRSAACPPAFPISLVLQPWRSEPHTSPKCRFSV
jgi:hypothetical protein